MRFRLTRVWLVSLFFMALGSIAFLASILSDSKAVSTLSWILALFGMSLGAIVPAAHSYSMVAKIEQRRNRVCFIIGQIVLIALAMRTGVSISLLFGFMGATMPFGKLGAMILCAVVFGLMSSCLVTLVMMIYHITITNDIELRLQRELDAIE